MKKDFNPCSYKPEDVLSFESDFTVWTNVRNHYAHQEYFRSDQRGLKNVIAKMQSSQSHKNLSSFSLRVFAGSEPLRLNEFDI